jgi:NADH:ubiquinone oxidoreductase subunit 4 (subunit M)
MVPVHLWLPEAHVEAPTGGSVILAGVLEIRDLWVYSFLVTFPKRLSFFTPLVYTMQWVSFTPLSQLFVRLISKDYSLHLSHESSNFRYFQL